MPHYVVIAWVSADPTSAHSKFASAGFASRGQQENSFEPCGSYVNPDLCGLSRPSKHQDRIALGNALQTMSGDIVKDNGKETVSKPLWVLISLQVDL